VANANVEIWHCDAGGSYSEYGSAARATCLRGIQTTGATGEVGVYAARGTNPLSNLSDGIFADSLPAEIVTPTGDAAAGYAATFQVGVPA